MTPEQKSWKERLSKLGLSQAAFASMVNIRYADLCLYFNCKREPIATTWKRIEEKLKELES